MVNCSPPISGVSDEVLLGKLVQMLPYGIRRHVERARHAAIVLTSLNGRYARVCPICGYEGKFRAFGIPPQFDAMCAKCDSLDRHRLFVLMDQKYGIRPARKSMLHFAPEKILEKRFRASVENYRSADLFNREVDLKSCNIEDTKLPDASFDIVFASHILEHVDDRKAMAELYRVLVPGGKLIAMVPIIDSWDQTYENESILSESMIARCISAKKTMSAIMAPTS